MKSNIKLSQARAKTLITAASRTRILVVGDVMLDQFIWGGVSRISPEAPVPVVDFQRESYMPGGAANVARNLSSLNVASDIFGAVGRDVAARQLDKLLKEHRVGCGGLVASATRHTSIKTRIVAHKQQVVRVDRETRGELDAALTKKLIAAVRAQLPHADALIVGDYGKGVVTQGLLDALTIRQRRTSFENLRIVICGDLRHSRVARSDAQALHALGADAIRLCAPRAMLPESLQEFPGCGTTEDFDAALDGADVVIMLRIQKERMADAQLPDAADYHTHYGLDMRRLALANPGCQVLHPGPINRGIEIAPEVADGPQSRILDQVANGVVTRMAVLAELLATPA